MPQKHAHGRHREHGFALLLVLWSLGFLSLMGTHLLTITRDTARNVIDCTAQEQLFQAADDAIKSNLYNVFINYPSMPIPGYIWKKSAESGLILYTRIKVDQNQVNPNIINTFLLQTIMQLSGVNTSAAQNATAAIAAWRQNKDETIHQHNVQARSESDENRNPAQDACWAGGAEFHSWDDILMLPAVGPGILNRLKPVLSLAQLGSPRLSKTQSLVREAILRMAPDAEHFIADSMNTLSDGTLIVAEAQVQSGQMSIRRHAEVLLTPTRQHVPWRIVRWETIPVPSPMNSSGSFPS